LSTYNIEKGGSVYPFNQNGMLVGGLDPATPGNDHLPNAHLHTQRGGFNFLPRDVLDATRAATSFVSRTYDAVVGKVPSPSSYPSPVVQPIASQSPYHAQYQAANFNKISADASAAAAAF
jgi:hypothetical protein